VDRQWRRRDVLGSIGSATVGVAVAGTPASADSLSNHRNVEVYDENGTKLPVAGDTGNPILANDVTQTIRIEAFPPDPDDEPLSQQEFQINADEDPVSETTIDTYSVLQEASRLVTDNENYLNIPYREGQIGYLTVTPIGTGEEVIVLRDSGGNRVQNHAGEDIVFDVLRSNLEVALDLGRDSVTPGESLTATVTVVATGEPLLRADIALIDSNGNWIDSALTDESGRATIEIPESARLGEYSLETRPAGYQPTAVSFQVRSPPEFDENLTLYPQSDQAISGTSSAEQGTTYTIEVAGPGFIEDAETEVQADGTFSAAFDLRSLSAGDEVTARIDGLDEVIYTLESPPAATVTMNPQISQNGDIVTVSEAFLPEGGYVVMHDANSGDVIGHTAYFEPGTYGDVDVLLDERLPGGENDVMAMPHLDSDGDEVYDFPDSDGPYVADGEPVTDTAVVSVSRTPASFEVTSFDAPDTVTWGDYVTVTARIENTGNVEATQPVECRIDSEVVTTRTVTLGGGASQAVEFTFQAVDAGRFTLGVYTDDDSQTGQLTVETPQTTTTTTTDTPVRDPPTTPAAPSGSQFSDNGSPEDESGLPWLPLGAGVAVSVAGLVGWLSFTNTDDRPTGNAGEAPPQNGGGSSPSDGGDASPSDPESAPQSTADRPGPDAGQSPTNTSDRGPTEQASNDTRQRGAAVDSEGTRSAEPESPLATGVRDLSNVNRLGRRGPLDVYTAVHADVADPVRVLTVADGVDVDDDLEAGFRDAVHGWRNLSSHPNVVTLQDWGTDPVPWVATEMVADATPFGAYEADPDVLLDVLSDVVEPVNTASLYSATHGNLTDETVLIADTEQGPTGLVDDWGVNRVVERAQDETWLTPYTAPEQLEAGTGGRSTEVFALGALAYEALAGEPPFPETDDETRYLDAVRRGPTPPSERDGSDPALDGPILRALAADPEQRHSSVTAFDAALRNER